MFYIEPSFLKRHVGDASSSLRGSTSSYGFMTKLCIIFVRMRQFLLILDTNDIFVFFILISTQLKDDYFNP